MHKYQDDSYGTIILPDTGDEYEETLLKTLQTFLNFS